MNAVSSTSAPARAVERSLSDRLLAAVPLLCVYVWLALVYVVEAWQRATPWLFGDELEATQLARSIAATGHPARRGTPYPAHSLYDWLTAPVWLIDHVPTAYAGVKYLDVLLMTAVVFPTYFLARLIVGRRAALFAAAGAGLIPSLAYTGYIVEENVAYPYAALCVFLIARALVAIGARRHAVRWSAAAIAAAIVAPFVRGELAVVPAIAGLSLLFVVWSSDRMRERRRRWSAGDWLGGALIVLGAIFAITAVASHRVFAIEVATRLYKHQQLNMLGWAAGALAVGTGALPFVGGLAALARLPGERRSTELRAVRSVIVATLVAFGVYTSVKAVYLSYSFGTRVEERNLIYVAPVLFVGTALLLDRRRVNRWALAASSLFAAYLVGVAIYDTTGSPYEMYNSLYSDALGLAILQQANRAPFYLTYGGARALMVGIAVAVALLLAGIVRFRARPRLAAGLTAVLVAGGLGWTLTAEIAAARGSNQSADLAAATLGHPFAWVDDHTGGQPTVYMGVGEQDPNPENLIEFWNRSITRVSSTDGSIGGPGPAGGPNLTANGETYWSDDPAQPGSAYAYAVEDYPCVDYAGTLAASHLHRAGGLLQPWRLVRLAQPNRLQGMCWGVYPDGWSGPADSTYFRFAGGAAGWLRVAITGGPVATDLQLQVGPLEINSNRQPQLLHVRRQAAGHVDVGKTKVVWIRTPAAGAIVHLVVATKFVPSQINPSSSDNRVLGVEVAYHWQRALPKRAKPLGSSF